MSQHVTLGTRLRRCYVTEMGYLSGSLSYIRGEIHIRSTDIDNTLMSNLIGFYGPSARPLHRLPGWSGGGWPDNFLSIPIHTVELWQRASANPATGGVPTT